MKEPWAACLLSGHQTKLIYEGTTTYRGPVLILAYEHNSFSLRLLKKSFREKGWSAGVPYRPGHVVAEATLLS
ncbi:MAG: hypothetical protein AAGM67_11255, partial [Bacteroidota bacterium]